MANFLKSTTDFVGSTAQQGLGGLQSGGKFVAGSAQQGVCGVGKGLNSGFSTVTGAFSPGTEKKEGEAQQQQLQPATTTHEAPRERQNIFNTVGGGIQSGFQGAGNLLSTGASATGGALTAGVGMVGDVTKSGLHIGETVAKAGLDLTGSVVVGTVGLAGTAVGGVVDLAAETSGAFSISVLLAIAIAAPAYAAVVVRIESEITGRTPLTWLSYEEGIPYKNETARSVVARTGSEGATCHGFGTAADRAPIISVIDGWCGRVIGTQVTNGPTVWARYDYGTFTVLVSGEAINGCNFVIDGNCNRLLRELVDQCNTGGENGKQGGYETDLCGQWLTDPGSNGCLSHQMSRCFNLTFS
ncbi:hypothetical protein B0H13DRAFT_2425661 [Mycena leptocephala]|nr:hypothetical protein B0H13DRAFT_2425661 [Mycena leptocephala]